MFIRRKLVNSCSNFQCVIAYYPMLTISSQQWVASNQRRGVVSQVLSAGSLASTEFHHCMQTLLHTRKTLSSLFQCDGKQHKRQAVLTKCPGSSGIGRASGFHLQLSLHWHRAFAPGPTGFTMQVWSYVSLKAPIVAIEIRLSLGSNRIVP